MSADDPQIAEALARAAAVRSRAALQVGKLPSSETLTSSPGLTSPETKVGSTPLAEPTPTLRPSVRFSQPLVGKQR